MKVIFNHNLDWFWQINDEWNRNHELIIPDNYKRENTKQKNLVDLNALENCIKENKNCDFIFGFRGDLYDLIRWKQRKINIPIIIFATNAIERSYNAKRSVFSKIWYVERYAKPLMEKYNKENLIYEGMAANQYVFFPMKIKKLNDIGFFGQHYGERGYWLNKIKEFCLKKKKKYNLPLGHGAFLPWSFKDINEFYNQTKINLSFAPKEPPGRIVNLRTFEICMSGNFQLMQYTPCVEEYFEIDEEIVCWRNKKELFEKIIYYLENKDEREKIAKKGYKRAIENHTWSKRIETIENILKKKRKLDITKLIIKIDKFLEKDELVRLHKLQLNNSNQISFKILKSVLIKRGYKLNKDLKSKTSIKINLRDRSFYYKPNLKNFSFIEFYGKIMMVVKIKSSNSEIIWDDWEDLKKILYLSENIDLSLPQYGVLTNGFKWLIHDFKNKKWLKSIPNRKTLKANLNLKSYFFLKIINRIKNYYDLFNLKKILQQLKIRNYLKQLYIKVVYMFR